MALTVAANFAEVFLAREGHDGLVGINFLEKIQFPTLPSVFGAMLAGVDYVLMGAGIPRTIPGVLDQFARGESAKLKIDVEDTLPGEDFYSSFDPAAFCGGLLRRPGARAETPAISRHRRLGHAGDNPRAQIQRPGQRLHRRGRDRRRPQRPAARHAAIEHRRRTHLRSCNCPAPCQTTYPCRRAYRKPDGTIGYRCPAEPVEDYVRKGGTIEETHGRECVCNGLVGTIGLPQVNFGNISGLPLVTASNEIVNVSQFLQPDRDSYTAAEVVSLLLGKVE